MPFPLHDAIIKNNPSQVVELIKKNDINIDEVNDQGLSLLQLAARFGMLELCIWLLYAGAKIESVQEFKHEDPLITQESRKSPLYLAIENGHPLVAQLFLACGANQYTDSRLAREFNRTPLADQLEKLESKPVVTEALYYWSTVNYIEQYNIGLIKRLIPGFATKKDFLLEINEIIKYEYSESKDTYIVINDNPTENILTEAKQESTNEGPWLAFAVQQGEPLLARELKKLGHQSPSTLRTPGYWAAMQKDESTFETVCQTEDDIANTLYQLDADDIDVFNKVYSNEKLVSSSVQKKYDEFKGSPDIIPLSNKQRTIYKAAARNDNTNLIKTFDTLLNVNEQYETIKYAYAKKDMIALKNLLDVNKKNLETTLLFELKQKKIEGDFIIFLLVANGQDTLNFSLSICESQIDSLKDFMELSLDVKGLAQKLIHSILNSSDAKTQRDMLDLLIVFDLSEVNKTNFILEILRLQYLSQDFSMLFNSPKLTLANRIESLSFPLGHSLTRLLNQKFGIFNIPELQNMAGDIWYGVFEEYLNKIEQVRLMQVSSYFHEMLNKSGKMARKFLKTERQLTVLSNFIGLTEKELQKKSWFSHRKMGSIEKWILLTLFLSALMSLWVYTNFTILVPQGKEDYDRYEKKFDNDLLSNNHTCAEQCPDTIYRYRDVAGHCEMNSKICDVLFNQVCSTLCNEMESAGFVPIMNTVFCLMFSIICYISTLVMLGIYRPAGQDRFNDITIINIYNEREDKLRALAAIGALITEFRIPAVMKDFYGVNQFAGLTTRSTLGAFLTKARTLKTDLKKKQDDLKIESEVKEENILDESKDGETTGNINALKSRPKPMSNVLLSKLFNDNNDNTAPLEIKEIPEKSSHVSHSLFSRIFSKNTKVLNVAKEEKIKHSEVKIIPKSKSWTETFFGSKKSIENEKTPLLLGSKSSMELSRSTYTT